VIAPFPSRKDVKLPCSLGFPYTTPPPFFLLLPCRSFFWKSLEPDSTRNRSLICHHSSLRYTSLRHAPLLPSECLLIGSLRAILFWIVSHFLLLDNCCERLPLSEVILCFPTPLFPFPFARTFLWVSGIKHARLFFCFYSTNDWHLDPLSPNSCDPCFENGF